MASEEKLAALHGLATTIPNPEKAAEIVIQRPRDAGFEVSPAE
jgi:hypothetical protein